jgi:hypothetical protein
MIIDSDVEMNPSQMMLMALKFNEKINLQDLEGLTELMTEDHTFINSEGETTKGKNAMKEGWNQFFKKIPRLQKHIHMRHNPEERGRHDRLLNLLPQTTQRPKHVDRQNPRQTRLRMESKLARPKMSTPSGFRGKV